MGEPLDKERPTRFTQDLVKDTRAFVLNLREIESAILFLQDQDAERTNDDIQQSLQDQIKALDARIATLEKNALA